MAKTHQNSMRLSDAGYEFLAKHEGVKRRLYNDPSGHCTIGIGHLVHYGNCDGSEPENFRNGLSKADVKALFLADIVRYENAVNAAVTVPLTQSQFDALVSFAYNEGAGAIHTLVKDTLNAGKPDAMCDDMVQHWTRSGKNPKMLLGRRQAEVALFKQSADTTANAPAEHAPHSEQVLKLHQHAKPNLAEHITTKYQTPLLHTKLQSHHDAAKEKDADGFVKRLLRRHGWLAPKGDRAHMGGSFIYATLHKFPLLRRFAGWQDHLDDGNESLSKRQMAGYIADGPQTKKARDSVFYRSWGFFTESSHDILQEGADFASLTSLYIDVAKTLAVASVGVTEGIDAPAIAPIVTALEGAGKTVGVVGASLNVYSTQAEAEHLGYRAVMGQGKGSNQNALLREFEQNNIDRSFAYLKWAVGEFKFLNPFKQIATAKKAGGFMGRAKSWMDWAGRLIKEASNTEWGQKVSKIVSWVKAAHQVYEFGRKVGQGLNLVWKTCVKNPAALLAHTAHYAWDVTKMGGHALSHLGSRALHLFGRGARRMGHGIGHFAHSVGHGIGHFAHGAAHFAHDIFHSATHAIGEGVSHGAEIVHKIETWMAERHFDPRRMAKDLALIGLHGAERLTHTQVFKGLTELPGHLLHHVLSGAARIGDRVAHSQLAQWLAEKRDATFAKVGAGITAGRNWITNTALRLPGQLFDAGGRIAHGAFDAFDGLAHRAFDGGSRLAHSAFGLGSNIAHRVFNNAGMMAHNAYDQGGTLAHSIFDAGTGVAERLGLDTTLAHKVFNTGGSIANTLFDTGGTIANRAFDTGGTIANRAFHNAGGIANRVFDTAGNIANRAFGFGGMIANRAFHNISEIPSRATDNILHPERTARRAFGNAGNNAHYAFDKAGSIAHKVFDAGTGLAQRFGIDTTYANRAFNFGGTVANKVFNTGGSIANKTFETGMGMAKRAASLPSAVMQRVSQLGGFLPTFGPGLLPQPAFGLPGGFSLPGGGLSVPSFGGIAQAAAPIAKSLGSLAGGALNGVTQAAGSAASAVGGFLGKTLGIQFSGQGGHPDIDAGSLLHGLKKQSSGFQPSSDLRGKLGGHLGFDPGGARLHIGPAAAQAARNLNAEAFTIGSDVFFGEGRFDPSSSKGLGLIAHELTHVGQQTGTTGDKTRFFTGRGGDEMEQEAQQIGERVLANAGRSQGVSVGLYDRRYESASEDELAPSDQQRLDMISLMALTEAENLLWRRGIKGRKSLDSLEVNVDLDLSRMSNQEAAQTWADAIVSAAAGSLASNSDATPRENRAIQRFEGGEHKWLGDEGYKAAMKDYIAKRVAAAPADQRDALRKKLEAGLSVPMKRLSDKKVMTYGSGVGLGGDFYGTAAELMNDKDGYVNNTDVDDIIKYFQEEQDGAKKGEVGEKYKDFNVKFFWNSENFIDLATKNTPHFAGHNLESYLKSHKEAIALAKQAKDATDSTKRETLWDQARFTSAFADHFLTDTFSTGHMRVPRQEIMEYFRSVGISDKRSGLMAKILHDYDNKHGIAVRNTRGDQWTAYGDSLLFADKDPSRSKSYEVTPGQPGGKGPAKTGRDIALEATTDSVEEIMAAYEEGTETKSFSALPLIPFPDPTRQKERIEDVFNTKMSPADRKKAFDALPGTTLAGAEESDVNALLDHLPEMLQSFKTHMQQSYKSNPDMQQVPQALKDGILNVGDVSAASKAQAASSANVGDKVRRITKILDSWWITDGDIQKIKAICDEVHSQTEMDAIRAEIEPQLADKMNSIGQRTQVSVILTRTVPGVAKSALPGTMADAGPQEQAARSIEQAVVRDPSTYSGLMDAHHNPLVGESALVGGVGQPNATQTHEETANAVEAAVAAGGPGNSVAQQAMSAPLGLSLQRKPSGPGGTGSVAWTLMNKTVKALNNVTGKSPVKAGKWNRPGKMPVPMYIGTDAHSAIADRYVGLHSGQDVFTNTIPISTILKEFARQGVAVNLAAVTAAKLGLKPDILNLTKRHLYEIKPWASAALALTEAKMYAGIFKAVGVPIDLGPTTEPGTSGIVPGPGGYFIYAAPTPGVIVYQKKNGDYDPKKVPVPLKVPTPVPVPAPNAQRQPQPTPVPVIPGLPVPQPIPSPVHIPIPAPSARQQVMDFVHRVMKSGENADQAAQQFMRDHPNLKYWILAAGVLAIVAMIAQDVFTAGVGIADNAPIIAIVTALFRAAQMAPA